MFFLELLGVLALIFAILFISALAIVGVIMVFGEDDITWDELEEERKYFKSKDNENSK